MSFSASISVKFKVDDESYHVNLNIPTATPTDDVPFVFEVSQEPGTDGNGNPLHPLLQLAIGAGTAGNENVALQLSPPAALLSNATDGKLEEAAVNVKNGDKKFDPATGQFQDIDPTPG